MGLEAIARGIASGFMGPFWVVVLVLGAFCAGFALGKWHSQY